MISKCRFFSYDFPNPGTKLPEYQAVAVGKKMPGHFFK